MSPLDVAMEELGLGACRGGVDALREVDGRACGCELETTGAAGLTLLLLSGTGLALVSSSSSIVINTGFAVRAGFIFFLWALKIIYILFTKTTAAQNEVALNYHLVRG